MGKKTIWIVDGAYLMKAAPGKFDFLKLKREIERACGDPLFESYYLNSVSSSPNDSQDAFHAWLKSAPPRGPKMRVQLYALKDMHMVCPHCGQSFDRPVQKGVDVGIATLILKLAAQDQYERLILSAGDGDFEDAISYVKSELHREIWVCGFYDSISADLQSYSDRVIWFDDWWDLIKRT
jgi:uncharacterized LabA/DUF88 family protein